MTTKEDTIAKITKRTDSRLAKHISADAFKLNKAITTLEKKIIAQVSSLSTGENGSLVGPKVNLKQAQKIHASLVKQFDDIYGAAARTAVSGYSTANSWVLENYSDLGLSTTFTDFDKTMIDQLSNQSMLDFVNIGNDARARVEGALYQSIAAQVPMEELIGQISAALTGQFAQNGRPLSSYAELYANDALMNYYNSVHLEKGRQLGLDKFYYSGTIMGNTRDFCRRRVGNVYTTEQINSWDFSWSGKSGPAMTNRGGWNCRHHWQPVDEEWIDDPDKLLGRSWEDMSINERFAMMKSRGMAMSPDEKLFKKRLNQLRYNLKTGKDFKVNSNLGKMWYNIPDYERSKIITEWQNAGINFPADMLADLVADMPPSTFVKIPGTVVPNAPPPLPKPPKVKPPSIKVPKVKPEASVIPPSDADVYTEGLNWDELNPKQKKDMGQMGYNLKVGKKYNPASQPAKTWNSMSYEAQQMKLKGWQSKGFDIPSNLPIKGEGNVAANIVNNAYEVVDDIDEFNWYATTPKEASEQFTKKFGFQDGAFTTNYATEAEGLQALGEIGEHWDGVVARHSKLEGIINLAEQNKTGKHVLINNSKMVGNGAAGVYDDAGHTLQLAGQLKKTGTIHIGEGGFSVASDFASVSRHEFGHYIDNTLRQMQDWPSRSSTKYLGWNHQTEWRTLYKKHQSNWKTLLGEYSSQDKYEGFAEAFCAYTSPDYKVGMLPKDIEGYLKKLLGGKVKVVVPPKPTTVKTTIRLFADPDNQKTYDDLYAHYKNLGLTEIELQEELRNRCPAVFDALKSWQGSTQSASPSALKLKAELLEARDDIKFFASKGSTFDMDRLRRAADNIPDEEYIRIRAFNQEYFARTNTKTIKLKRGTDGQNSGPAFARKVNTVKAEYDPKDWNKIDVEIREPALNGWSTNLRTADNFGSSGGGITTTSNVPVEDVFCSDKLWPKYRYKGEKEWIIIRSEKQTYKLSEISSGFKDTAAATATATPAPPVWKVPQKVVDQIDALPSIIEEEVPEAISLYIQKIPKWQTLDKDEIVEKLTKKYQAIQKALNTDELPYMFPGKKVGQDTVDVMKEVVNTLNNTEGHSIWVKAVEEFDPVLFDGFSLDPVVKAGKGLSKSKYNIVSGAKKLPEVIDSTEELKTMTVKVLDSYDYTAIPDYEIKDLLGTDILIWDSTAGDLKILGHTITYDAKDEFISLLNTIEDAIQPDVDFTKLVEATKLKYF